MRLTESEAKEKWCPFQGVETMAQQIKDMQPLPAGYATGGGGHSTYHEQNRCIASKCMAWRWNQPPGPQHPDDKRERDNRGWCGLAGVTK